MYILDVCFNANIGSNQFGFCVLKKVAKHLFGSLFCYTFIQTLNTQIMEKLTGTKNVWVNTLVITVLTFIFICLTLVMFNLDKADTFAYNF